MLFNYCGWFLFLCLLFCYWCFCLVVFYGDWKVCDGNYLFPFCWEPCNTVQYFITPCNTKQWKWCTGSYLSPFCWGLVNEKSTFSPTQIEVKFKGHCKLYVVYFRHLKWQHHHHWSSKFIEESDWIEVSFICTQALHEFSDVK